MSTTIPCMAIDDEPLALELVSDYIRKTPFLSLTATCNSAIEAIRVLEANPVPLLFLDIQMPGLTGLSLMRSLTQKPRVIFTTAYEHYALEGFRLDAIDYLLKPFDYEEFLKAALKASDFFSLEARKQTEVSGLDYFFVKSEYKLVKVEPRFITHVEGLKDYVKIYLINQPKPLLTLMSLKSLEAFLPAHSFVRVHRSYIVHIAHIAGIERNLIHLSNGTISMGEGYKNQLMEIISRRTL